MSHESQREERQRWEECGRMLSVEQIDSAQKEILVVSAKAAVTDWRETTLEGRWLQEKVPPGRKRIRRVIVGILPNDKITRLNLDANSAPVKSRRKVMENNQLPHWRTPKNWVAWKSRNPTTVVTDTHLQVSSEKDSSRTFCWNLDGKKVPKCTFVHQQQRLFLVGMRGWHQKWLEEIRIWLPSGRNSWNLSILEILLHFLTTCNRDVFDVNANRRTLFSSNEFLQQLKNCQGGRNLAQKLSREPTKKIRTSCHKMDSSLRQPLGSFDLLQASYEWWQTMLPCGKHASALSIGFISDIAGELEDSESTSGESHVSSEVEHLSHKLDMQDANVSVSHVLQIRKLFLWMLVCEWTDSLLLICGCRARLWYILRRVQSHQPTCSGKPLAKCQHRAQKKRETRGWAIVKCRSRCHERKFFRRRSSVIYFWGHWSGDQNEHQRQKSDNETRGQKTAESR